MIRSKLGVSAFEIYLRTGRRVAPVDTRLDALQTKFNPYHDPDDGRFTFAPGGPRSLRHIVVSPRRRLAERAEGGQVGGSDPDRQVGTGANSISRTIQLAQYRPPRPRGSNYDAMLKPETLEQAVPGLSSGAPGAIIAIAEPVFSLTGPSTALNLTLLNDRYQSIYNAIKVIDPTARLDQLALPTTVAGALRQVQDAEAKLANLRWQKAVEAYRSGDAQPLQITVYRFIQQ